MITLVRAYGFCPHPWLLAAACGRRALLSNPKRKLPTSLACDQSVASRSCAVLLPFTAELQIMHGP